MLIVFGLQIFFLEQHMILYGIINLNDCLTFPVSVTSLVSSHLTAANLTIISILHPYG